MLMTIVSYAVAEDVTIVSDRFEADEGERVTKFIGHVHMKKGNDELNASRVIVHFDAKRKPIRYEAIGQTAFAIHMKTGQFYRGKADKMVYIPQKQIYEFYGHVVLKEPKMQRTVTGEKVVVEKMSGKASVQGGAHEPVKFIFKVEEKNDGR